jgi:hypothetical protein
MTASDILPSRTEDKIYISPDNSERKSLVLEAICRSRIAELRKSPKTVTV